MQTGIGCKPVCAVQKSKFKEGRKTPGGIIMYGSVSNSSHNSSLLHFYVSVLRHSFRGKMEFDPSRGDDFERLSVEAHVLSDSGASHKFIWPDFLRKLERFYGDVFPVKESRRIKITTANAVINVPLRKVELVLNLSEYIYKGWFIVFDLVKYDIVLGKEWLAEVEHTIDYQRNILKLGWQKRNRGEWAVQIDGLQDGNSGENQESERGGHSESLRFTEMDEHRMEVGRIQKKGGAGVDDELAVGEDEEQVVVEIVMAEIEAGWKSEDEEAGTGYLMSMLY